jgi:hypothetical protein
MKKYPKAPKKWKKDRRYKIGKKVTREWRSWYYKYVFHDDLTKGFQSMRKGLEENIFMDTGFLSRIAK